MSEKSYQERLNIPQVTIQNAKDILKKEIVSTIKLQEQGYQPEKTTFRLIGDAGVGKTHICQQICDELSDYLDVHFEMIMVKAPVLSRDDFLIPFPANGNDGIKKFQMYYSDFVPHPDQKYGLFVIDELSRGDYNLQQLLWQAENELQIHQYKFPIGWFVISLDNPDEQDYSVDVIEDAAGTRRKAHVFVRHDPKEFLDYASYKNFHPAIVDYFSQHHERIYDFQAKSNKMVFTNPASIEKLSDICWKYEQLGGLKENLKNLEIVAGSLLNVTAADQLIDFIQNRTEEIKAEDVIFHYFENNEEVRKGVQNLIENGEHGKLAELMSGFVYYLATTKPDIDNYLDNVAKFLRDMPADTAAIFMNTCDEYDKQSDEFRYLTENIHGKLNDNEDYQVFFNKMQEVAESDGEE